MAVFEIKSDLPIKTQNKIDYIELIPSAQRTVSQAAFLTSLTPYLTNAIVAVNVDGMIVAASGLTVPTGYSGFAKGAFFTKTDATGNGQYMNTGTTTTAAWDLVDQATASNIDDNAVTTAKINALAVTDAKLAASLDLTGKALSNLSIESGTPVNAVAASKLLTIGTNPINQATVSLGGVTYRFMSVLGAGVAATGTLTMNTEQPHDGDTVIMGNTTYTFKTALTPTAGQILIDDTTSHSLDNLIAAVEGGAGEGTKYATGTLSQGMVTATKASADTMLVTYDSVGFLGNQYDTLGTATHATWGATTLTGGIDAQAANDVLISDNVEHSIDNLVLAITLGAGIGTNYGTGTVVNPLATAVKASVATMTATNKVKGVIGNSTAIAETLADGSWAAAATFLGGGVDGTVGAAREILVDTSNIYICTAANTIADANWKKSALASL